MCAVPVLITYRLNLPASLDVSGHLENVFCDKKIVLSTIPCENTKFLVVSSCRLCCGLCLCDELLVLVGKRCGSIDMRF